MRMRGLRLLGVLASAVLGSAGCHSPALMPATDMSSAYVAGQTLVYRFPSGRTYQAEYACEEMTFVLLRPQLSPPPSKTMPFSARAIRPGIDLVIWEDAEVYATFVVDLPRRQLHASALRDGSSPFLGQAEIIETRPTRDVTGAVIQCESKKAPQGVRED